MQLALVKPEELPVVWPLVQFKLRRAIDKIGMEDFSVTEDAVLAGRADLWVAYDLDGIHAGLTTHVTPNKICIIGAYGGKRMRDMLPLLKQIEFYAKNVGCTAMRIIGRKGWSRVLPEYKPRAYITERKL